MLTEVLTFNILNLQVPIQSASAAVGLENQQVRNERNTKKVLAGTEGSITPAPDTLLSMSR